MCTFSASGSLSLCVCVCVFVSLDESTNDVGNEAFCASREESTLSPCAYFAHFRVDCSKNAAQKHPILNVFVNMCY